MGNEMRLSESIKYFFVIFNLQPIITKSILLKFTTSLNDIFTLLTQKS